MKNILILYYTKGGSTKKIAEAIALGVESANINAILRTVPNISANIEKIEPSIPEEGNIYATKEDLLNCDGIIVGSPSYFGNMASPLKFFLEQHSDLWFKGNLIGKPAGFFVSASGMHSGHESTLLSMMIPFLHHGCLMVGIPYNVSALEKTKTGGTPYGASFLNTFAVGQTLSKEELEISKALGLRVAKIAQKLAD